MRVNTSEEYLDELLEAIEPIIKMGEPEPITEPVEDVAPVEDVTSIEEEVVSTEAVVPEVISDMGAESFAETTDISDLISSFEDEEEEEDIEAILEAASQQAVDDTEVLDRNQDVKELLKQFTEDDDLSDIQDILDKNDSGKAIDDSLLDIPNVEVFQLEDADTDEDEDNIDVDKGKKTKKIGEFFSLFKRGKDKKKKKSEKTEETPKEYTQDSPKEEDLSMQEYNEIPSMEFVETDGEELELVEDMSDIEQLLSGVTLAGTENEEDFIQSEDLEIKEKSSDSKKKPGKEKKETFLSKIFKMLTEDMEEPDKNRNIPEAMETVISDENLNILEELSIEDRTNIKKDKKSKKKGKNSSKDEEDAVEGKGKKDKKPKKEKKKREKRKVRETEEISQPSLNTKPEKKLPRKRVLAIFVLCFSIMAGILILQNVVIKDTNSKEAAYAFDNADYATCFANLNGIERSEKEEALYQKSYIIMSVQRKWDAYNSFLLMNEEVEALNALLEGVEVYREKEAVAQEWGVHGQILEIYRKIMDKLSAYGLSEEDITDILGYDSRVTYTRRLDSIVNKTPFVFDSTEGDMYREPQPLLDVLPQEEDFLPENVTDVSLEREQNVKTEDEPMGETVVVGSNPVNISDEVSPVLPGENVGSGNTNVSIELDEDNIVISDM